VPKADIVISSTGAPHAIFRKEHGEKFLHARKNRPMFFIDIAVPRDIDPGLNDLDGIFVYNIDDLQQVVASHLGDRKKEAARAEVMVEEEVRRFEQRAQTAEVVPTIVSLQQHLETLRQAELDRVRGRLGTLSPEQEMAIEALTRGIINKIMHTPITTLKSAARDPESTTVVDVVRKLFNLRAEPGRAGAGPAESGPAERRVAERRSAERGASEQRRTAPASSPDPARPADAPQPAASNAPVPPLVANQSRK
jgi:glutamyl-tRNA reductase